MGDVGDLKRFFNENPLLYGGAPPEDLAQLSRIHDQYPDSVRLLSDREAIKLEKFECRRCGACCATVKYITVAHADLKRWVAQKRWDIIEELTIDRTATPLLAMYGADIREAAKSEAKAAIDCADSQLAEKARELLYITSLLECAVFVTRKNNACTFLESMDGLYACRIHETCPRVCEKFPFYLGRFTDSRLVKEDSFCPALQDIARKKNDKN